MLWKIFPKANDQKIAVTQCFNYEKKLIFSLLNLGPYSIVESFAKDTKLLI